MNSLTVCNSLCPLIRFGLEVLFVLKVPELDDFGDTVIFETLSLKEITKVFWLKK